MVQTESVSAIVYILEDILNVRMNKIAQMCVRVKCEALHASTEHVAATPVTLRLFFSHYFIIIFRYSSFFSFMSLAAV